MDKNRYCVIMCGGVGSRFWPYSRTNMPKQFIDFFGTGRSLLQMSVDRIKGVVPEENIIMITNAQYAGIIAEQLPQLRPEQILLEPARRNTAPCIAWAAYHIKALNPKAKIMVAPSDHLILKTDEFRNNVNSAFEFLEGRDVILTMGIKPSRPETGYGYIQVGNQVGDNFMSVKAFTEKPDVEMARMFIQLGEFYWNSGMFFWSVDSIITALRKYAPDIDAIFDAGVHAFGTPAETQFIEDNFPSCRSISIDFAVMEKAPNVFVECVDFGWSDLGTWGSLYENSEKNGDGNATQGCKALLFNSKDNIVAVKGDKLVVASGLNDYIIADTEDALLIVPKNEEQTIRLYVNDVKAKFGDKFI